MEDIASSSSISNFDYERDLKVLFDAFGSVVSLEVIAAAYYESNHNVDKSGEIICKMQRSTSIASSHACETQSSLVSERTGPSKSKKCTVSMGTVSGLIGKDYVNSRPSRNEPIKTTKPLKIDSGNFPISEILGNEGPLTVENDIFQDDIEKFIFAMLGDGFQLDRSVVHKVLGCCGFNVKESMEKLFYLSASTLEKSDDVLGIADVKSTGKCTRLIPPYKGKLQRVDSPKIAQESSQDKEKLDLEREVLASLFSAPERVPKPPPPRKPRFRPIGKMVNEPLKDVDESTEDECDNELQRNENEDEDDENSFLVLREAVKEHWITMKGYYEAAVDAFLKGDIERASKLREQGHAYGRKAREADEKSAQKIIQTDETCGQVVSLNILNQKPKEAKLLLKSHLTSLSGIPSMFRYLKVIVGPSEKKTKKPPCKELITKLLDKESIKWSEEQNGEVLLIRVDLIDPKQLGFTK